MWIELLCSVTLEVSRIDHEMQDLLDIVRDQTFVSLHLDHLGYLNILFELFEREKECLLIQEILF